MRIPKLFRNFYVLTAGAFVFLLLFLDDDDLITGFKAERQLRQLESEKEYYTEQIEQVKKETTRLTSDRRSFEKLAREKYLLKRPAEDVYIIVREKEKNN